MSNLGIYVAAAVVDGGVGDNFGVVLFREPGTSNWVEVHRNTVAHTSTAGTGFCGISGLPNGSFIVAVGQGLYKASVTPTAGCLSWFDGFQWHEVTVPATYRFTDVYVPQRNLAYVTGYDTGSQGTGRIWRWEATNPTVFTEVHSRYDGGGPWPNTYYHISGSGLDNIWVSLVVNSNSVYNKPWVSHYDGVSWTDYSMTPYSNANLPFIVSEDHGWMQGGNFSGGDAVVRRWEPPPVSNWPIIHSHNPSGSEVAYSTVGTDDYALIAGFRDGANRIYKWTQGGGLVSKWAQSAWRLQRIALDRDGQHAFAVANNIFSNLDAVFTESLDAGETWTALAYFQQYVYRWAGGILFASGYSDLGVVAEDGGYEVEIEGTFPIGAPLEVFMGQDAADTDSPCYGGSGRGYQPISLDGATLRVITPPSSLGSQILSWRQAGGGDPSPVGELTVIERNWAHKQLSTRVCYPPWAGVGRRRLEIEEQR